MKKHLSKRILVLTRREMLGFLNGTLAVTLLGCWRKQSASIASPTSPAETSILTAKMPACAVKPQQTEGPYFVDEKLNRSDIRSDPSNGSIERGVPLRLVFQISQISGNSCTPLNNAMVDVWHCNAAGIYSDAIDRNFNTIGKKFLRGYQQTNANGIAEFLTVYPGWYPGRAVHIHFKIRINSASQKSYEFTSQLYFDDALTDRVHAQMPYVSRGKRTHNNNRDGIFQQGGDRLILPVSRAENGYVGKFDIGLDLA